jgi:serine/threonine protein kinase
MKRSPFSPPPGPGRGTAPPESADAYRLGDRLHAGRTGDVYEAEHPWLPGLYAIKILHPSLVETPHAVDTFRDELATIASLRHPNIAQIIEVGTVPDGRLFVVMELLEGRTLADRLVEGRPIPVAEALPVIKSVAGALQAAHARGVLHRQLTPGNIFLARAEGHEQGFVKLLDFGIARLRSAAGDDLGNAADAARAMAPEQAQGRGDEIDGRIDEFALAAVAYRMLAGVDAFAGDNVVAVLYGAVHEPVPPMPVDARVDPGIEAVVRRGLAKDPGDRFDTVLDFARALETVATEPPLDEETASRTPVVANAGALGGVGRPDTWRGPVLEATGVPDDAPGTLPDPARSSEQAVPSWASGDLPHVPALAGSDADMFPHAATAFDDVDLDDDGDIQIPRERGRLMVFFVTAAVTVAIGVGLGTGWRPPVSWRQSRPWHALHLPGAVPAVTSPAIGGTIDGIATAPPGSPSDPATAASSSPAVTAGESAPPVTPPSVAPAADAGTTAAAALPDRADAALLPAAVPLPLPRPVPTEGRPRTVRPPKDSESAASEREAPPSQREPQNETDRPRRRGREPNRDVVWSDRLQRLVPASDEVPPSTQNAAASAPAVPAPPPVTAPAPTPAPPGTPPATVTPPPVAPPAQTP